MYAAKTDNMQQNSKYRLCGDRDEIVNHIISKCSKLAQKEYKTRHNSVGKMIQSEVFKRFKFDHTTKWYIQKPESVLKNKKHKILSNFEIKMDLSIPAKRPGLALINKKKELVI